MWHVGPSSLTRDQTQTTCIRSVESLPLNQLGSPSPCILCKRNRNNRRKMVEFKPCSLTLHIPLAVEVTMRSDLSPRGRITCIHPALAAPHPKKSICVVTSLAGTHSSQLSHLDPSHHVRWGEKVNIHSNWLKQRGQFGDKESGQ